MSGEILKQAKCKFCGADNDIDKNPHVKVHGRDVIWIVYCDNCSASTKICDTKAGAITRWSLGHYTIPIQTERQIYDACVNLMHGLVEDFKEWIEWQGIEVPDDELFQIGKYPTEIVNRLFLWHTTHSGGTSTRAKCRELGIEDSTKMIKFEVSEDEE